ncbi:MAG TPA: hypothetical protein VNV43_00145 [Candidatus Acidoferrales bacterium]|nr:hypothetical protein [Candidatus Acidoferrales bacterium]
MFSSRSSYCARSPKLVCPVGLVLERQRVDPLLEFVPERRGLDILHRAEIQHAQERRQKQTERFR